MGFVFLIVCRLLFSLLVLVDMVEQAAEISAAIDIAWLGFRDDLAETPETMKSVCL